MGDRGAMFRSSERQQIIDYIIRSKIKDGKFCCHTCVLSDRPDACTVLTKSPGARARLVLN
jgi:hypothetical protein